LEEAQEPKRQLQGDIHEVTTSREAAAASRRGFSFSLKMDVFFANRTLRRLHHRQVGCTSEENWTVSFLPPRLPNRKRAVRT
jgi:hypothetical protein